MKRQNAISGSHATAVIRDHADMMNRPDHEILPDGPLTSGLEVLERKDLLPLLAQRIAQLPLPEPSAAAQQELRLTMRHLPARGR